MKCFICGKESMLSIHWNLKYHRDLEPLFSHLFTSHNHEFREFDKWYTKYYFKKNQYGHVTMLIRQDLKLISTDIEMLYLRSLIEQ